MENEPKRPREGNRITRVYTRTGDGGMTQLVGGREVPKRDLRLHAYGTVDELQVWIGVARDALHAVPVKDDALSAFLRLLDQHLVYIQNRLFTLSGDLATLLEDRWSGMPLLTPGDTVYLEQLIDAYNAPLPALKDFVLHGGHAAATGLQMCRVVCRRAERAVNELAARESIGELPEPFLNRLSDAFFVLGRRVFHELNTRGMTEGETIWQRDLPEPALP